MLRLRCSFAAALKPPTPFTTLRLATNFLWVALVALKILFISSSQSTTTENGFVAGLAGVPFLKFNNLLVISLDLETIGQTRAQFNQT